MSSAGEFFKVLGMMMLMVGMAFGVAYWIRFAIKKAKPDLKFWIKYKLLKMKHKQADVEMLMEDLDDDVSVDDLERGLLLSGRASPKKAKELLYIYQGMKQLQGGEIK